MAISFQKRSPGRLSDGWGCDRFLFVCLRTWPHVFSFYILFFVILMPPSRHQCGQAGNSGRLSFFFAVCPNIPSTAPAASTISVYCSILRIHFIPK
jgi:hypothetical protein